MTFSQWGHVGEKKKTPRTTGPDGASEVDALAREDGDAADTDVAADGALDGEVPVGSAVDAGIGVAGMAAPAEGATDASGPWATAGVPQTASRRARSTKEMARRRMQAAG
jgi:hypothetical protein